MSETYNINALQKDIKAGDRRALARGITLIESSLEEHQADAQNLLTALLPKTGRSIRLGITGVPGVGKSTFIEAFGLHVIKEGHKVAVLAIDPSSTRSGGSILGDKTRMHQLSVHEKAYIRPSPTGGALGGVARRTREAMLLCEAAGYDVIIVETVGVGQSETEVSDMVDMFLLLLLPGGGDELQGIKRGIVELADLIVVSKADGDLLKTAKIAQSEYQAALRLITPKDAPWQPKVLLSSSIEKHGIAEIWQAAKSYRETVMKTGGFALKRSTQAQAWMWKEIRAMLLSALLEQNPATKEIIQALENQVASGAKPPTAAAREVVAEIFRERSNK